MLQTKTVVKWRAEQWGEKTAAAAAAAASVFKGEWNYVRK